jgi:hypothetical protein
MRQLEAETRTIELDDYRGAYADERHVTVYVEEPTMVYVDGADFPSVVYVELERRLPEAVAALQRIRYATAGRTASGMLSTSRTFGYAPKLVARGQETCRDAKLASEDPEAHATIAGLAAVVEEEYRRWNPQSYEKHEQAVRAVLAEWRLEGTLFTSGIINRNNKLPYHFDRGNFPGFWSNMLVFKRACAGGNLVCPELDVAFRLRDHSLLMFDGQALLHGVSPFRITRPNGYRFTVVYYSLQQMWRCETRAESVELAARRRTEWERARFA